MYREIILATALSVSLWSGQRELSDLEYAALLRYEGRAQLVIGKYQKMRSFAKISPSKAEEIAKSECMNGEEIASIRLKRERKLLYYRLGSEKRVAKVNALDGALIDCRRREE